MTERWISKLGLFLTVALKYTAGQLNVKNSCIFTSRKLIYVVFSHHRCSYHEGALSDTTGRIVIILLQNYWQKSITLTIIFSKRSMISFSERFMERSSNRGWGTGSSDWVDKGSVGCWMRGFSFFIPVFLKLVIRSRWKKAMIRLDRLDYNHLKKKKKKSWFWILLIYPGRERLD